MNDKTQGHLVLAGIAVVAVGGVYWMTTKAAKTVGGIASGNNELTKGTAYEGQGLLGTLGASMNIVSGGALESFGSWLGGKTYDLTH
jgi:hypothetical protein